MFTGLQIKNPKGTSAFGDLAIDVWITLKYDFMKKVLSSWI